MAAPAGRRPRKGARGRGHPLAPGRGRIGHVPGPGPGTWLGETGAWNGGDRVSDELIWTGSLSYPYRIGGHVGLYDTTLRDGEQTVGVVLDAVQKLEIARKLDELGVARIEAGFPRVSAEDAQAIQLMSEASLRAELWGFSRAVKADVEEILRLGLRATIIEAAHRLIRFDERWKALAASLRAAGKPACVVAAAIANRWVRWLFNQVEGGAITLKTVV